MRKQQIRKLLSLWLLLFLCFSVHAADWPATLYMAQTSFSSTGRVTATGVNGVYEFSLPYTSSTGAPKYYIFTSASSSSNAKKGTFKTFGASATSDGTNIQPEFGKKYDLVDISTAEDATILVDNSSTSPICAFLPLYCQNITLNVTVDLNDMSVVFSRVPAEEETTTLAIFNRDTSTALATTNVGSDGKARYSIKLGNETLIYFGANTTTRSATNEKSIWGSSTQVNPQNIPVTTGSTYSLERTTYFQVYTRSTCAFSVPAGKYDIIADINTGEVEFAEFTGKYRSMPTTLYMRSYNFSTSYDSSTGSNGIYKFTFDKNASYTSDPFYAVFTEATSVATARNAAWVLGSTLEDSNIAPEYGKTYPLIDVDPDKVNNNKTGTFMPIYPQKYEVVVDLNAMTVTFNPLLAVDDLTTLNILNKSFGLLSSATKDTDGKFHYSYRGAAGTEIFFSTGTIKAEVQQTDALSYGAGGHANPIIQNLEIGQTYPAPRTSYRRVVTDQTGFFVIPGKCDLTFDPETNTLEVTEYSGKYISYPPTLNMKSYTFSSTNLATASGDKGVYKFKYDKSTSYTTDPICVVFTDAANIGGARTSSWVLGSTSEATNITPEYGKAYPLADVDPDNVNNTKTGTFMPIYPQEYEIVLDLNTMTVTFNPVGEIDDLTTLNILNDSFKVVATATKGEDGNFAFSFRGKPETSVFFSTATSANEMKTTTPLSYGAGGHANPVNIAAEYDNSYEVLPITYRRIYSDKTGFFELPGKCDIIFNPETMTFSVKPYSGQYDVYPEVMYLKLNSLSSTNYATATGNDGIYTFEYTTQTYNNAPRNLVFSNATSYSQASPSSWTLGASDDGSNVSVYPGLVTPVYDVDPSEVYNNKSYFTPIYPYTYTITLDIKNRTVTWGEPAPAPASLKILDDSLDANFQVLASGAGNSDGIYTIETRTYSRHPICIADAETLAQLRETPWIFTTGMYPAQREDITDGLVSPAVRGTHYTLTWSDGWWMTPEGVNELSARVDINNNTIEWSTTPFTPREAEVLYMFNNYMEPLSKCVSDNSGVFEFDVTLTGSSYVGFSDSDTDKNDPGRVFYGASAPYRAKRVTPESGVEYDLFCTAPSAISNNTATYYLTKGRWQVRVDMNTHKVSFKDISRGGTWYVPENVALCDDDLNVIATPTASEEGVFTFTGVAIESEKGLKKVVLLDTAEGGSIFGANATGDAGPTVVSSTTYDLYMPEKTWVVTDGASCFGLTPATYNITVDFNEKTIVFVDPTIPIYPEKIALVIPGEQPTTLSTASGNGTYTFSLDNKDAVSVIFSDPADGTLYGAATAAAEATDGGETAVKESEEPTAITIPEGLWTVVLSLADMKATYTHADRPVFVSTTMPSGTPFVSYFGVGTEPQAVFTFNNNIKSAKAVYVVIGDYTGGEPVESATTKLGLRTAVVSDNTIVVGFNGQHYTLPEGAEPKVHIILSKVVDTNEQTLVCDPVAGLPAGSLVFEYPFEEFERITVDGKCDPKSDSNIDNLTTVWLYVNHFDDISFSNVMFAEDLTTTKPTYAADEDDADNNEEEEGENVEEEDSVVPRTFPAHWEAGKTDANGYTEMIIDIPMAVRGLGKLRLYLENLAIDDSYTDHEGDIDVKLVSNTDPTSEVKATPENGSTVGRIDEVLLTWTHPIIISAGNVASKATFINTATDEKVEATYSYPAGINTLLVTPETPIEAEGKYKLVIDKGDLVFNDDIEAKNNNPMEFNFTVDPSLGIGYVTISETDDVEVVDLSGILVRKGKGRSVLEGLSGIYIVNGVKCLLSTGSSNTKLSK